MTKFGSKCHQEKIILSVAWNCFCSTIAVEAVLRMRRALAQEYISAATILTKFARR